MTLEGRQLIGQQAVRGTRGEIRAINPSSSQRLEPVWNHDKTRESGA
ncbi:hypothetical protein [Modicisalibacter tunisiensis]|uniref:Uncharacterized protein n=1 Tax=Modicisalibacter tunisiensis TaxID=390637 RepID=A0ABS7X2A0_9GAMM|nr:hypothetical protein [Modicisalibacter tunisiensis]MBZ9537551.1 hypothetical protein [Modicisalibacter tunisiensis]MBZ9569026.1 hypothetical protein [Modicisalibacter tunisiensis]